MPFHLLNVIPIYLVDPFPEIVKINYVFILTISEFISFSVVSKLKKKQFIFPFKIK